MCSNGGGFLFQFRPFKSGCLYFSNEYIGDRFSFICLIIFRRPSMRLLSFTFARRNTWQSGYPAVLCRQSCVYHRASATHGSQFRYVWVPIREQIVGDGASQGPHSIYQSVGVFFGLYLRGVSFRYIRLC